jgi:hypothetical protein
VKISAVEKPGIFANLERLFLGTLFTLPGLVLYFLASWEGIGLGGRWGLLGMIGFIKPLPPRKIIAPRPDYRLVSHSVTQLMPARLSSTAFSRIKQPDSPLRVTPLLTMVRLSTTSPLVNRSRLEMLIGDPHFE